MRKIEIAIVKESIKVGNLREKDKIIKMGQEDEGPTTPVNGQGLEETIRGPNLAIKNSEFEKTTVA